LFLPNLHREMTRVKPRIKSNRDSLNLQVIAQWPGARNAWEAAMAQVQNLELAYTGTSSDERARIVRPLVKWFDDYDAFIYLVYTAIQANSVNAENPLLTALTQRIAAFRVAAEAVGPQFGEGYFPIWYSVSGYTLSDGFTDMAHTILQRLPMISASQRAIEEEAFASDPDSIDLYAMSVAPNINWGSGVNWEMSPSQLDLNESGEMIDAQPLYVSLMSDLMASFNNGYTGEAELRLALGNLNRFLQGVVNYADVGETSAVYVPSFADQVAADIHCMWRWMTVDVLPWVEGTNPPVLIDEVITSVFAEAYTRSLAEDEVASEWQEP